GILVIEIGLFSSLSLLATGLGIFLFGWALGQWGLYQVYRSAPAQNKFYERILNLALLCGWLSASGFLLWIITDDWNYVNVSLKAGIWLFLLPVLFTVSHRMLPFFSSSVIRDYKIVQPGWSIPVFVAGCVAHLLLELNYLQQWLFIVDLPLALLAWYHSISWKLLQSFQDRLLAVLHIGFLWLAIGMSLYSLQSLYLLSSGELILGRAPLHALTIGFITSMLIAMASRVSLGHSGRQLVADNITWLIFLGLQAVAMLRILAEINPLNSLLGLSLNVIAALLWVLVLGSWVVRYGPIYLSARIDGRPG
ncbi:MAG TPA: NnrS family protein, partial [Pseudomonadales bacterium]